MKRLTAITFTGLLLCQLGVRPPCLAAPAPESPEVLKIRPEKIEKDRKPAGRTATEAVRDPFNWSREQINRFKDQEPKVKSNSVAGLTLSGIIWDNKKPLAIINDRVVAVGDTVQGSTILEILKDMVVFEQDSVYHTLWLQPDSLPIQSGKGGL